MGIALMGTGMAEGESRATEATHRAIASPLLEEASIEGAKGILVNITGGPDLTLHEVNEASSIIREAADDDANIIFGAVIDERMENQMKITVIATGFDKVSMVNPNGYRSYVNQSPPAQSTIPTISKPMPENPMANSRRDDLEIPAFMRKKAE
jgi:cell division protein FtsZ